jgi:hypothetical protein
MTMGILSSDGTAIAFLPFSNSIGFDPSRTKKTYDPFAFTRHQGKTRCCLWIGVSSPFFFSTPKNPGIIAAREVACAVARDNIEPSVGFILSYKRLGHQANFDTARMIRLR